LKYKWLYLLWLVFFIFPAWGYMRYLLAKKNKRGAFGVGIFIAFSVLALWAE